MDGTCIKIKYEQYVLADLIAQNLTFCDALS